MKKKYLFQFKNKQGEYKPTWYVRVIVPPLLQKNLDKQHIVRSLGTRDINIAMEKRHAAVNDIMTLFERTRRDMERGVRKKHRVDPKKFLEAVNILRDELFYPRDVTDKEAMNSDLYMEHIEKELTRKYKRDPKTGHFTDIPPEVESEIARGFSQLQNPNRKTLSETLEEHLEQLRRRTTHQIAATRKARVLRFLEWLGDDPYIDKIERETVSRYLRRNLLKQGYAINTIKCHLGDIRAVFSWAKEQGMLQHKDNPVSGLTGQVKEIARGNREKTLGRWQIWTEDEILAMLPVVLNHQRRELFPMFIIALYSGMRREEIAQTELADIHERHIYLHDGRTESPVRVVPIHPIVNPLIEKLKGERESGYLVQDFIGKPTMDGKRAHHFSDIFSSLKKKTGVTRKGVVFHSLRHTFISASANAGIPAYVIDTITGHATPGMLQHTYAQGMDPDLLANFMQDITHGKKVDKAARDAIKRY